MKKVVKILPDSSNFVLDIIEGVSADEKRQAFNDLSILLSL